MLQTEYIKIETLNPTNIQEEFSAQYWNDAEKEKNKIWGKWESHFNELEEKFTKKGLLQQFNHILQDKELDLKNSNVTSLASGICLLEAQTLRQYPSISKMTCLEFSKHRIFDIAPGIFAKYEIPPEKVELRLGSFLDTQIESSSQDIVILSQAFHHTEDVDPLLREIKRILTPQGHIIIIGEHFFGPLNISKRFFKHFAKYILNHNSIRDRHSFFPTWRAMFPIDTIKGDHHYNRAMYRNFFKNHDLFFKRYVFKDYLNQAFYLTRLK